MYRLTNTAAVVRLSDGAWIPADLGNADYAAFIRWQEAGNEPQPYVPPAAPPIKEVTMRQARLALAAAGKLGAVESAIESLPEPERTAARIEWEYSGTVQRDKPLVLALAPALALDDAALDALFTLADTL